MIMSSSNVEVLLLSDRIVYGSYKMRVQAPWMYKSRKTLKNN